MDPFSKAPLYAVSHPEKGFYYGLGCSSAEAWDSALLLGWNVERKLYPGRDNPAFKRIQSRLRREGWRAMPVTIVPYEIKQYHGPSSDFVKYALNFSAVANMLRQIAHGSQSLCRHIVHQYGGSMEFADELYAAAKEVTPDAK